MRLLHPTLAMAALFVFASCGGDPSGPGDDDPIAGNFTLALSGDLSGTIDGDAGVFWESTDAQTDKTAWVLSLTRGDVQALEGLQLIVGGNRPVPGEYTVSAADPDSLESGEGVAFLAVNPSLGESAFLGISVSGALTVTESSAEVVAGTLLLSAQGTVFPDDGLSTPGLVVVDGSFRALLTEPPTNDPTEPPTQVPN